jgi:hypothetical protein
MHVVRKSELFAIALLVAGLGAMASPARAAEWEWTLAPYMWGSDIALDVSVNDEPVIGGDLGFSDLLDKIDFAFLGHFEGRRGKGGFFLDAIYMDLGDHQTTVARPPLPGGTEVRSDVKQTLYEVGGFFRPSGDTHGLDLLFGVRVIDFDMDLTITLPGPLGMSTTVNSAETFTDGFAGLRYSAPLGERWSFALRGDAGAGDSELTWNTSALLGYRVGKRRQNVILFGYRHMEIEFKDSSSSVTVQTDMTMSGPLAGFAFRF